jgi:transketolase
VKDRNSWCRCRLLIRFLLPVVHTVGIEVCTGPLGQGISNAVGLAMSERHLAATFNEPGYDIFDHFTYVICGDGCMQEGVASEASSLAGHLGLGRLIVMYDDNSITIDGDTNLSFTEDVLKRYEAYGWHTQTVSDVTGSLDDLRKCLATAQGITDKPSIIKVKTAIGYGSPSKQGSHAAHGAPLGKEDLAGAKTFYGLPPDKSFHVPADVKQFYDTASTKADSKRLAWEEMFAKYSKEHSEKAGEISRRFANKIPDGLLDKLPAFKFGTDKDKATRVFSQGCLGAIAPSMPELVGGSADLTPSNLTDYPGVVDFQKDTPAGRYFRFGVREMGMVAVCNGMFAHGGMRPYCATFLVFSGYAMGSIRLSALSRFGIIFVMTHDSIGLGEDGPTHQPIEALEQLRSMPNLLVYRPADSNETSAAYKVAVERHETPTVICCSRSAVPALENSSIAKATLGAYVLVEPASPVLTLVATGTEVGPSMDAAKRLTASGIATRVVSMPCQEIFLEQTSSYQKAVLPGNIPTLSIEASSVYGWHRFSHAQVGMTTFGASGSGSDVFNHFGFNAENIASKGKALVDFYKTNGPVPDLSNHPVFEAVKSTH